MINDNLSMAFLNQSQSVLDPNDINQSNKKSMEGFFYNGGLLTGRDSLADINNSIKNQKNNEK